MKIIGQMVCGPGEADKYLKYSLDTFKRLCDDAFIVTCNAGPKEKKMIKKYDFWQYEDNREWGKYQPFIKTKLLNIILQIKPDWILVLDADESLPTVDRGKLEQLTINRQACFFFIVTLWDDEQHYMRSWPLQWNVRFYKADKNKGTQFLKRPLHCGNAPPYFYNQPARQSYVPHIVLHRGMMTKKDRLEKAKRYDRYDPEAVYKDRQYYDSLLLEGTGTKYNQVEVIEKINNYCKNL